MATAPAVTSKSERASELRAEVQTLGKEVSELQQKLEPAQRTLGSLQDKRRELAESGKPGGDLHLKIADAEGQVDILRSRLSQKQSRLDTVRANLESLEYELRLEGQREARQARLDALANQGREVTARIAEKLRALIEEDLPAFDAARDALTREFVNVGGAVNMGPGNPEATAARKLIHELEGQFWDGSVLTVERRLRRAGWEPRGESGLEFTIRTLRPPRK